jgi:hypothetical protein
MTRDLARPRTRARAEVTTLATFVLRLTRVRVHARARDFRP